MRTVRHLPRGVRRLAAAHMVLAALAALALVLWGAEDSRTAASIALLALSLPAWACFADGNWRPEVRHSVGDYLVCGLELYRLERLLNDRAVIENCASLERIELPVEGLQLFAPLTRRSERARPPHNRKRPAGEAGRFWGDREEKSPTTR